MLGFAVGGGKHKLTAWDGGLVQPPSAHHPSPALLLTATDPGLSLWSKRAGGHLPSDGSASTHLPFFLGWVRVLAGLKTSGFLNVLGA